MRETIQTFIDSGDTYRAYCQNTKCGHHQVLDMIALRDRLGPDHGAFRDDLASTNAKDATDHLEGSRRQMMVGKPCVRTGGR